MIWMLAGLALQAVGQIQQNKQAREQQKAQNKAIEKYNEALAAQAGKQLSQLNVQRSALAQQVSQALTSVQAQGLSQRSGIEAQAAASDTMGNSVEQGLATVNFQVDQAKAQLQYNENLSNEQINAQMDAVADQAGNSMRTGTPLNSWGSTLGSIAGNVGTTLLANKASTGSFLGSSSAATGTSSSLLG